MPLPADTDVSTPKYLRDKYAIVGVGETDLYARVGQDDPRAGDVGAAQRRRGCGDQDLRHRRHAVLFEQ